jgi:AcrR family transcriptional regulator
MQQRIRQATSSCIRRRIVQAAIRLHREIGFKKTTVADIARGASMSPANVYRFFPSKQAIEEAVVADLFEHVSAAATFAARGGSALERLTAALRAISQLHEHRLKTDSRQHELVAAAVGENWAVALSYADRIRGLVRAIIAAGQASGELRPGSSMAMTCCLLEAMDGYLNPSRINAAAIRPTFDEMMDLCAGALRQYRGVSRSTWPTRVSQHDHPGIFAGDGNAARCRGGLGRGMRRRQAPGRRSSAAMDGALRKAGAWAVAYRRYSLDYVLDEDAERRNIWSGDFDMS